MHTPPNPRAGALVTVFTLLAVAAFPACKDENVKPSSGAPDTSGPTPPPLEAGMAPGGGTGGEGGVMAQDAATDIIPELDRYVADMPIVDVQIPDVPIAPGLDVGPFPDVGPLDGENCDPRLHAAACPPGNFCVHVPGQRVYIGRCQAGDQCSPATPGSCPDPARPYCHLRGGATFCMAEGVLEEAEDCVDELEIPQPCEAGLLCNNSVCQAACDPAAEPTGCAAAWRCEDISAAIGGPRTGLCQPPACDWFTGRGCEAGEKCAYSIRNDGRVVGSCTALEGQGNAHAAPCSIGAGGGDNCANGLVCVGPPDGQRVCRHLCDTGGYQAPCPEAMRCVEALATRGGPVRGLGICITNQ
ncbi:MAG: hypothetical protein EXR76_18075 [Myxococcales bacterium]|nr:hypothetical protein [Myxococcales bacterium]